MNTAYYTCICMLLLVKGDLAENGDIYDSAIVKSCPELENDNGHPWPSGNMNWAAKCGNYYYDSSTGICIEGHLYPGSQILIDPWMERAPVDNRPSSFYLSLRKPPVKTSAFPNGIPKDVGRTDAPGQANQSGWISSVDWQNFLFGWPGFSIVVAVLYGLRKILRKCSVLQPHVEYGAIERVQFLQEAPEVVVENPLDHGEQAEDPDETIVKLKYGDESNSVGPGLDWESILSN